MTIPIYYNIDHPPIVEAGALILCHSPDAIGWAIRLGEKLRWRGGAYYNHAAIAVETGTDPLVVQATDSGVTNSKRLSTLQGGPVAVVPPLPHTDPDLIVEFAQAQTSSPYGYLTLLGIVFTQLTPHFVRLDLRRGGSWICSALAAEALRFGGWLAAWPDVYQVSPAQLAIAVGLDPAAVYRRANAHHK